MSLWTPTANREALETRRRHEQELYGQLQLLGALKHWNKELKQIDPYLELVWAPESATAPGLTPGRYHIIRHNPTAPPSLLPLETDDGGFLGPGEHMFRLLEKSDMWDNRVKRDRVKRETAIREARLKAKEAEREATAREIDERLKVAAFPSVLVSDVPWLARAGGRKG